MNGGSRPGRPDSWPRTGHGVLTDYNISTYTLLAIYELELSNLDVSDKSMELFQDQRWREYRDGLVSDMKTEVSQLRDEVLENSTDYLTMLFTEKYLPSKLEIHDPKLSEGSIIEKDVSDNPRRATFSDGPVYIEAQQIDVKVPYDGPQTLLKVLPTTFKSGGVRNIASIGRNEILFHVDFFLDNGDAEEVEEEVDRKVERIRWFANRINSDIDDLESDLETEARQAVENQRSAMETKNEVLESIGADTDDEPTGFVKPERARSIELPSQSGSDDDGLPVLPDRVYRDMLGLIDDLGINIEQSKEPVRGLGEESLRDIFLAGINSHYSGLASGESFNRGGKTDIRLPYENENLFIAECKFWSGPSKYQDTLDQLLEYLNVRDSQAAVMIFSRNEDFPAVKEKMADATINHDQCDTKLTEYDDHEVYQFRQSSDSPVKIAIKAFDVSI